MADDPGFMEQLTGSAGDDEQEMWAYMDQIEGNDTFNVSYGLAKRGGTKFGAAAAGLIGGAFGRQEGESYGEAARRINQKAVDSAVARNKGISIEDVQGRRAVRKALTEMEVTNTGTPEARLQMAMKAAEVANQHGSPEQKMRALTMVDQLKKEVEEWRKLELANEAAELENAENELVTGFDSEGNPMTGILKKKDGIAGMDTAQGWRPFDESFSLHNPKDGRRLGGMAEVHKRINDATTPSYLNKIREQASGAMSALVKTDRVLDTLTDLWEKGGVGAVMSESGKALVAVDNFVRNATGFVESFASDGRSQHNNDLKATILNQVREGTGWLLNLIELPEGVKRGSAAAQQHQAAIMEMAYMAARLAEPSNRGLSDNDIANALKRIAGGTSNPQVMARRFLEMQADAAAELDFTLGYFKGGALGDDITDDMVDRALLGKSFENYQREKKRVFEKYGVQIDGAGRAVFEEGKLMDSDVAPGEGAYHDPNVNNVDDMTDAELLDEF
jgi:hypothetical protein